MENECVWETLLGDENESKEYEKKSIRSRAWRRKQRQRNIRRRQKMYDDRMYGNEIFFGGHLSNGYVDGAFKWTSTWARAQKRGNHAFAVQPRYRRCLDAYNQRMDEANANGLNADYDEADCDWVRNVTVRQKLNSAAVHMANRYFDDVADAKYKNMHYDSFDVLEKYESYDYENYWNDMIENHHNDDDIGA